MGPIPRAFLALAVCLLTLRGGVLCVVTDRTGNITFQCPDGWMIQGPDCYLLVDFAMPRDNASHTCQLYGASLVDIQDEVEAKTVGQMVQENYNQWKHFWIGNTIQSADEVCMGLWDRGEPAEESSFSPFLVAASAPQGRWSRVDKDTRLPSVCKAPACLADTFRCMDGSKCLSSQWTCDGVYDCDDQSDEINCTSQCTQYIRQENGMLNENSGYAGGKTCTWIIEGVIGRPLSIVFNVSVEADVDYIEVWSGGPTVLASQLQARLTGQQSDRRVLGINHFLIVRLVADITNQDTGFTATWGPDEELSPAVRDVEVGDSEEEITSPYYGIQSPDVFIRQYNIFSDNGSVMSLEVLEEGFEFEAEENGAAPLIVVDLKPRSYVSRTDKIFLTVMSPARDENRKGEFKAQIQKGCYTDITAANGVLQSPQFAEEDGTIYYPPLLSCTYIVRAPADKQRNFDVIFSLFVMSDPKDTIKVYNGSDKTTSPATFSSASPPVDGESFVMGPVFLVEFASSRAESEGYFTISFSLDCPPITNTGNMGLSTMATNLNTEVTITCDPGYAFAQEEFDMQDSVTVRCERSGKWNVTRLPKCQVIYCGVPKPIDNGFISNGSGEATYGHNVTYQCFEGFAMTGSAVSTCGDGSMWSELPTCTASMCPPAGDLSNGSYNVTEGQGQDFGTILEYMCDPGYDLVGSRYSLCESNGTWSHSPPDCIAIKCPLPVVDRATLSSTEPVEFNSILTVTCDSGFQINGQQSQEFTCDSSGHFGVQHIACEDVDECDSNNPCGQNTMCTNTEGNYSCECEPNYTRDVTGACTFIDGCDDDNGGCDMDRGSCLSCDDVCSVTYSCECNEGYTLFTANGTEEKYIPEQENGMQRGDIYHINHTCVPKACQPPPSPSTPGLQLLSTRTVYFYNETVEYRCDFGYNLTGSRVRTCGADGNWAPDVPVCEAILCDPPSPTGLVVGVYPNATTQQGEMVIVECDSETGPKYNKTLYCAYDGEMDVFRLQGDAPHCPAIDCGPLTPLGGENFTPPPLGSRGLRDTFTFSCLDGFTKHGMSTNGSDVVECQSNGRWGFGNLTCEGARCTDPGTPGGMYQVSASFEVNGLVEYRCNRSGFEPSPKFLRCQFEQNVTSWNDSLPTCVDVESPTFTSCPTETIYLNLYDHANMSMSMPVAEDNSGLVLPLTVSPPGFRLDLPLSQSVNVTYTARDTAGNSATCEVQIVVNDPSVLPVLNCPDYLIVNITSGSNTTFPLNSVVSSDAPNMTFSTGPVISVSPVSVGSPPVEVRVTATNRFNFYRQCAFLVETRSAVCLESYIKTDIASKNADVSCTDTLTCTVTCKTNYAFQDGRRAAEYRCTGENEWSPALPVRFCVETAAPRYEYSVTVNYGLSSFAICESAVKVTLTDSLPNRTSGQCFTSLSPNVPMNFALLSTKYVSTGPRTVNVTVTMEVTSATSAISSYLFGLCKESLGKSEETGSLFAVGSVTCGTSSITVTDRSHADVTGGYSCDPGTVLKTVDSSEKCVPCEPGYYYETGGCVPCPDGQYQDLAGQLSCKPCADGAAYTREPRLASSQCVAPCPPGFFNGEGKVQNPGPCIACAENTYLSAGNLYQADCTPCASSRTTSGLEGATASSQCVDKCTAGQYPVSSTECEICPAGFYKSSEGNFPCVECADNQTTIVALPVSENDCVAVPAVTCENGGNMVSHYHINVCECPDGYYGDLCEKAVDTCQSAPCYNGGMCSSSSTGSYTCECPSEETCEMKSEDVPWTENTEFIIQGLEEADFDTCKQKCLNNSLCGAIVFDTSDSSCYLFSESFFSGPALPGTQTFVKSCTREYFFSGTNCEIDLRNDCTSDTCDHISFCRDKVNDADCVCPSGGKYTQPRCEQNLNLCENSPCKNGAECEDSGGGVRYTCICQPGYTGRHCEININECVLNPDGCLVNQTCVDGVDEYTCECGSYSGDNCQTLPDFCPNNCANGLCYNDYTTSRAVCYCEFPYRVGPDGQCEEINLCEERTPCENNSTCQRQSPGQYRCDCLPGYTGFHCQHNIDECASNPCQHGGECMDQVNSYQCDCSSTGYTGDHCETLIETCPGGCYPVNTANTTNIPNGCLCSCKPGFTGEDCMTDIDECLSLPCKHGGTCNTTSDVPNDYTCICQDGWTGKNCELLDDYCSNDTCDNGGNCISLQTDFFCQCSGGTYGRTCQTATKLCDVLNPCVNSSMCQNSGGTAVCNCPTNYAGSSCHLIEDGCDKDPCQNEGSCVNNELGYTCTCQDPYSGSTCETKDNPCDPASCPTGSSCEEISGEAVCLCGLKKLLSGSTCKEMSNNFDIYFTKKSTAIESYEPFQIGSNELTLAFWVAPLDSDTEDDGSYVQIVDSGGTSMLRVGCTGVYFRDDNPVNLTSSFQSEKWNLIVVTWTSSGSYDLFLNYYDSEVPSGSLSATFPARDQLLTVLLGSDFHGYISQVSVWNRVLSYNTDILQRVFIDPLDIPQSGLVFTWTGYKLGMWTQVITPSMVKGDRAVCDGGKYDEDCDTVPDKGPPEVSASVCPQDDVVNSSTRLVQITEFVNPDRLFMGGGQAVSSIGGTLVTFGAHRVVYATADAAGNVATCRFNAYIRRPGQSCGNRYGLDPTAVEDCGSSGGLTVNCPNNKVPLFSPNYLTCGKLGSFNLDSQYRLPPGLLCGLKADIHYKATLKLKYELAINCLASHETAAATELKKKVINLRSQWRDLCSDSACNNAVVTAKCDSSGSAFVTATVTLSDLPATLTMFEEISRELTARELLDTAVYELDAFSIDNVAAAKLQKSSAIIVLDRSCVQGYGLSGDNCVECVAGSYLDTTDTTCKPCDIGTYTDSPGETACTPCDAGKTTLQSGSTACVEECTAGRYYDTADNQCKPCPKNFYQPQPGQVACLPCPAGKLSEGEGTVSLTECFDTCPAGEQLVDSVCQKCLRGTYLDGVNMEMCTDCPAGYTTAGEGATSKNLCDQSACDPGKMRNATSNMCMPCDYGYYQPEKWQDECLKCNDSYTTKNMGSVNASQCMFVCEPGYEDVGNNTCMPCQKSFYRSDSLEDRFELCSPCDDIFTTEGNGSISSGDCKIRICQAGTYRNVTDNECYQCPIGYYQPDDLQTECINCSRNLTTMAEGSTNMSQCVFYCAAGYEVLSMSGETCSACPRGEYKTNIGEAKFGMCEACRTGTTTDDMASVSRDFCNVTVCEAGQIVSGNTCSDCPVDTYQTMSMPYSYTECMSCDNGYGTKSGKQTQRDACQRYCSPGQQVNLQTVQCEPCPQGFYNTGGPMERFKQCAKCPTGYVTVGTGATHQDNCTLRDCHAGTFIENDNCTACPVGTYQDTPRQYNCTPCPPDTNTSAGGATDISACTIYCPAGQEEKDNGTCGPCDDDEFKAVGSQGNCYPCQGNVTSTPENREACNELFCDVGFTNESSNCVACGISFYKDVRGNTGCTACPLNTTTASVASTSAGHCSVTFCDVGLYSPNNSAPCLPCPVGTYKNVSGNDNCTQCPSGYTTAEMGSDTESDCDVVVCPAGQYRDAQNTCQNCRLGSYQSMSGQTSCEPCESGYTTDTQTSNSSMDCKKLCDAGSYRYDRTTCQLCPVGEYQAQNQSAVISCTECEPGFTTERNGSTSVNDCYMICPAGQYLSASSRSSCLPCALGTYQSNNGSRSCDPCGQGNTTLSTGSTHISDCQPLCRMGQYLNTTERKCYDCPLGTYNPTAANENNPQPQCEKCPAEKTTSTTGSVYESACNVTDCRRGYRRSSLTGCEACPKGMYQPEPSQSDCLDCPDDMTTLLPARISINACVEACGDGSAWNVVNETCDLCPLGYYRKGSEYETCIKCPDGNTTLRLGASECTPSPIDTTGQQTTPAPPQTRRLVVKLVIRITYCTNVQQMTSVIKTFVRNILLTTNERFAALCEGTCDNLSIRFRGGCLGNSRRRRQTQPENRDQEVELELLNVPEEISGISSDSNQTVTQRTTDVVTRAFYNHQQEQDLLDRNKLVFVEVASAEAIVQCQPGQKTAGSTCKNCEVGTYSSDGDVTVCELCPLGQYQDLAGQSSCKPCEERTYTTSTGTNSSTLCIRRCDEPDSAAKYCSGHGSCVYDSYTDSGVRCDCDERYTALDCSVRTAPDDSDKMTMIGGIIGGTAAFLVLLLIVFGIVACLKRSAKRGEKKGKQNVSEHYPDYRNPLYDSSAFMLPMGRPAIMYADNPAADQDIRDYYVSERGSHTSRKRSQSYEDAWRDMPEVY